MKSPDLEKVSLSDVRRKLESHRELQTRKPVVERASQANAVLLDETSRWITELPANVRPIALARKFPRIANSIAELWRRVAACKEYLDSLLVDQRGDRTGFPPDVAKELQALRSHYADLHPQRGFSLELVERDD